MSTPAPSTPSDLSLLKLENQVCFPLYAVSRMLTKAYQPFLQELDLTYPQYLVLLLLWEHQQLSVKALGDKLLLDSGTLTPLLKRMEQKQWLSRHRDPQDERSVLITLQPAGQALQEQACRIPEQMMLKLHLSATEVSELRQQLAALLTRLS